MLVLLATVPHLRSLSSPDLVPPLRPPQNPNGLVQIVAVKVVLSIKGLLGVLHYELVVSGLQTQDWRRLVRLSMGQA